MSDPDFKPTDSQIESLLKRILDEALAIRHRFIPDLPAQCDRCKHYQTQPRRDSTTEVSSWCTADRDRMLPSGGVIPDSECVRRHLWLLPGRKTA